MSRPSVLHVVPSFAGGGSERQLALLAKAQVAAGARVHIAYLREGPNFADAASSGSILHPLPVRGSHDVAALGHLRKLCQSVRPDVVQTWLLHADVCAGLVARWASVPWILSERASTEAYAQGAKFWIRRILGRRADMIVANSDEGARYWRAVGFSGTLHVIHNIVPPPHTAAQRETAAVESGRVVAVGRLCEQKNYPVLLDAMERVAIEHSNVQLDILGEGHLRNSLQQRIDGSALLTQRVRLLGFVDDVPERLRRAALFVSTSRFEGTANAQLDAMMAGCPMVLSDIPSHRELVDDGAAVFVRLDDPQAVAAAISHSLRNPLASRAIAERAGAQLHTGDWTGERIAARYLALYDELIQRRGR